MQLGGGITGSMNIQEKKSKEILSLKLKKGSE